MSDRDEEIRKLEILVAGVIHQLEPGPRSQLLRKMAHALRASQSKRIQAQRDPDGVAWTPRKPQKRPRVAPRPIRFLYRKPGAAEPRVADLKSWRRDGPYITGFDREAEAIRTFQRSRIIRHLPAEGTADPGAIPSDLRGKKGQIRKRALRMFDKMRRAPHLRYGASPTQAWVDLTDRAARIAKVSQFGLKDRVVPDGPEVQYPQRIILGFSIEDREAMLDVALAHVGSI